MIEVAQKMKRNFGERILGRGGVVLGVFLLSALGALAMLDTRKVTVESKDGERATRYILIGRQGTVYLVEQLSATRCVKGKNWNHDDLKIWVDDGCRAVFEVHRNGFDESSDSTRFKLESVDGKRKSRRIDTRGGVRLIRQLSDSDCREGRSWGYNAREVWVDDGCRAEFEVFKRDGSEIDDGYEDDRWKYVKAESNGRLSKVYVDTGRAVMLFRKLSGAPCNFGRQWGFEPDHIWVDDGCRALFRIRKR